MIKTSDLKRGTVVEINKAPHAVEKIEFKPPSARGAQTIFKIRFKNLLNNSKLDASHTGDDSFSEVDSYRINLQYLYKDSDSAAFMDIENFTQFTLPLSEIENEISFLTDGMENIKGIICNDVLIAVEIPVSVTLQI
ncbi:MAG: elongation factor P-like protein YeiP, partial [Spirochaetes bacterium GWF1_41_5]